MFFVNSVFVFNCGGIPTAAHLRNVFSVLHYETIGQRVLIYRRSCNIVSSLMHRIITSPPGSELNVENGVMTIAITRV